MFEVQTDVQLESRGGASRRSRAAASAALPQVRQRCRQGNRRAILNDHLLKAFEQSHRDRFDLHNLRYHLRKHGLQKRRRAFGAALVQARTADLRPAYLCDLGQLIQARLGILQVSKDHHLRKRGSCQLAFALDKTGFFSQHVRSLLSPCSTHKKPALRFSLRAGWN